MRKVLEACLVTVAMLGWWGFIYPELCFTADTCQISEVQDEAEQEAYNEAEYEDILEAAAVRGLVPADFLQQTLTVPVEIKSRLLTYIQEKIAEKKEIGVNHHD